MTYYYMMGSTIAKQVGGVPPTNDYVAVSPEGIVRHVINDKVIEQEKVKASNMENASANLAHSMLVPTVRNKKKMRKKVKRCRCK